MGILDRMQSTESDPWSNEPGSDLLPTQHSTPDQGEPFVVQRVRAMLDFLLRDAVHANFKQQKMAKMIRRLADEALSELCDVPPELVEHYFTRTAAMMYWAATGETILNIPLDENFKPDPAISAKDRIVLTEEEVARWESVELEDFKAGQRNLEAARERAAIESAHGGRVK
jgi:hypothetical protein